MSGALEFECPFCGFEWEVDCHNWPDDRWDEIGKCPNCGRKEIEQ